MSLRRFIISALAGAASAVALAACGINTKDTGPPPPQGAPQSTTTNQGPKRNTRPLPAAPANTVRVNGLPGRSGLSADATRGFAGQSTSQVAFIHATEAQSFRDLCSGRTDVVEVGRLPTAAELTVCHDFGVDLSDALQVGADAIVLATKNETDVGGDCITVAQARDIYRAGSPYTNWSQLGFGNVPLHTTGREDGSPSFDFFGQIVLGLANPTVADVRSDYRPRRTDQLERFEVTNHLRDQGAVRAARNFLNRLEVRTRGQRKRIVDAAVLAADRAILRQIARVNASLLRRNANLSPAQQAALVRSNLRRDLQAKSTASLLVNRRFDANLVSRARRFFRSRFATANAPGVLGYFRFPYYELFEEQLRPLEIDFGVPELQSGQPVALTDLSDNTLRLLRTPTRTRGIAPSPALLAARNQLPAKTKSGQRIYPGPNCVFPSQVTITTGAYPLTRRIFIFTTRQSLARTEVQRYLEFLLRNARLFATRNRLVPITDQQLTDDEAAVANRGHKPAPVQPRATVQTRTVTTPQGTTTTETVTTPARTTTTPVTPSSGGVPGVSNRG